MTSVFIREEENQKQRKVDDRSRNSSEDVMLLALKTEEVATAQGIEIISLH